jgi:hypothetical protein
MSGKKLTHLVLQNVIRTHVTSLTKAGVRIYCVTQLTPFPLTQLT